MPFIDLTKFVLQKSPAALTKSGHARARLPFLFSGPPSVERQNPLCADCMRGNRKRCKIYGSILNTDPQTAAQDLNWGTTEDMSCTLQTFDLGNI
jgi:hypothetical protein